MAEPLRLRTWLLAGMVILLAASLAWTFGLVGGDGPGPRVLYAESADSLNAQVAGLAPYLVPVGAAPEAEDFDAFLPALEGAPLPDYEPPALPTAPLRVSSILIAGGRRVAIINDRAVRPGDTVDGAEVVDIESNHVVVRDQNGSRRILEVTPAAGGSRP